MKYQFSRDCYKFKMSIYKAVFKLIIEMRQINDRVLFSASIIFHGRRLTLL